MANKSSLTHKVNAARVTLLLCAAAWACGGTAVAVTAGHNYQCNTYVHNGEQIEPALRLAQPGSVICVLPGVYHEQLSISASGSVNAPIVLMGVGGRPVIDGEYTLPAGNNMDLSLSRHGCPGSVTVTVNPALPQLRRFSCTGFAPLVGIYGSNIVLQNLEVTRSTGTGIAAESNTDLSNIKIVDNFVHSVRQNGIDLHRVVNADVEHNEVADSGNFAPFRRRGATINWGAGIGSFGVHNADYIGNVIHDNWGDALLVDSNVGGSSYVTIENNVFYDNYSSNGVYAHAVNHVVVRNNLFYCSSHSGVYSWSSTLIAPSESSYKQNISTSNILVANNVYANCPNGGIVLWDTKPGARSISDVSLVNNTFFREPEPISASGSELNAFEGLKIDKNLEVKGGDAAAVFAGAAFLTGPHSFDPGTVKATWFAIKKYKGVGADASAFAAPGLF